MNFEDRLENWGAYYQGGGQYDSGSVTYEVCRRMAIENGSEVRDGYREIRPAREIDEDDARIIEWCWVQSANRIPVRCRALLKAHYVSRSDPRVISRLLRIRHLSYKKELAEAVKRFEEIVQVLEKWGSC